MFFVSLLLFRKLSYFTLVFKYLFIMPFNKRATCDLHLHKVELCVQSTNCLVTYSVER